MAALCLKIKLYKFKTDLSKFMANSGYNCGKDFKFNFYKNYKFQEANT